MTNSHCLNRRQTRLRRLLAALLTALSLLPVAHAVSSPGDLAASGSLPGISPVLLLSWSIALLGLGLWAGQRSMRKESTDTGIHDALTGLPNRALLLDRLHLALMNARREARPLCLVHLDLDDLDKINERLGHKAGDELLAQIAVRLQDTVRKSDTVARLGGRKFALLAPGTDLHHAPVLARKIMHSMETPFVVNGETLYICTSLGMAIHPHHGLNCEHLMQHASTALFHAKREADGFHIYASEHENDSQMPPLLTGELRRAIENHELVLHYQPKFDLRSGWVHSIEALVRWNHPSRGLLAPDLFIPIAERTGLIQALSMWVLDEALAQCAQWQQAGLNLRLAVNLSPRNLQDPRLTEQVAERLQAHGLAPENLELEITESATLQNPENALRILSELDQMGVYLSIDDFGTGYSSLAYLKRMPVNEIKIDKSFVFDLTTNQDDRSIVSATIDLAHRLGMQVIAEGVENSDAQQLLKTLGCDSAQGFHIARPMSHEDLRRWFKESGMLLRFSQGVAALA